VSFCLVSVSFALASLTCNRDGGGWGGVSPQRGAVGWTPWEPVWGRRSISWAVLANEGTGIGTFPHLPFREWALRRGESRSASLPLQGHVAVPARPAPSCFLICVFPNRWRNWKTPSITQFLQDTLLGCPRTNPPKATPSRQNSPCQPLPRTPSPSQATGPCSPRPVTVCHCVL